MSRPARTHPQAGGADAEGAVRGPAETDDVRVPAAWTRPLAVLVLIVVAAHQVQGVAFAVAPGSIPPGLRLPYAYLASWDMFSEVGSKHRILEIKAVYSGVEEPLDAEALFPTRWESGLRFERPALYHTPKMRKVAAAICGRAANAAPARPPEALVLTRVSWPRRAGRRAGKPGPKAERQEVLRFTCGTR